MSHRYPTAHRALSRGLCLALLLLGSGAAAAKPNVVLILTDNHGAWTLGCYGNPDIRTPHLDGLAAEGTLFERAFASNPVCSPTRATLLTGLLPSQHGVHCFLRGGRLQIGPEARNTLADFTSLPEILADAGYRCGLVGKWHLGANLTPQEGLTDEWVTMPHGATSTFYDANVIENGAVRKEPTYLTGFWTERAVRFLERSRTDERPFFLYLSYNGPYALGRLLLRDGRNRHTAFYAEKPLDSFPREPVHPWQYHNREYINNPTSIRRVATEVSGVDDGVGRVLETLDDLGLAEDTLVLFTADQGWVGGHGGLWGMGDHTDPVTAFDGMMRVPMIWRWPGHVKAGARRDELVANYDILPTLLDVLGMKDRMPNEPRSPGRSFASALDGSAPPRKTAGDPPAKGDASKGPAIYYEFEGLRCIRTETRKLVLRVPGGPNELYDLVADPEERHNRIDDPSFAADRDGLTERLMGFFDKYAAPRYDLWRGGGSQTVLYRPR